MPSPTDSSYVATFLENGQKEINKKNFENPSKIDREDKKKLSTQLFSSPGL